MTETKADQRHGDDTALLALTEHFERVVLPEFERRAHNAADASNEIAAWDQAVAWLQTFVDAIASHQATTLQGLKAKARAGRIPGTHGQYLDEIDEGVLASIIRDLLL